MTVIMVSSMIYITMFNQKKMLIVSCFLMVKICLCWKAAGRGFVKVMVHHLSIVKIVVAQPFDVLKKKLTLRLIFY